MHLKDLIDVFQKIVWLIGFGVSLCETFWVEVSKKLLEAAKKHQNHLLSRDNILLMVAQNPINPWHFLKELNAIFSPNCDWCFAVISRKCKKWEIFDILITMIEGVKMTTRQMIPFFSSTFWAVFPGIFHFYISRPSKFNSMGCPLHFLLVCKMPIYMSNLRRPSLCLLT